MLTPEQQQEVNRMTEPEETIEQVRADLARRAAALGISSYRMVERPHGLAWVQKTLDQLAEEINERLPEGEA